MKKINIKRIYYDITHKYLTLNNIVMIAAFCVAAGWVWGSLSVMQRNYGLQKELDIKKRQLQILQLEATNLELEKKYYQTTEYQELAVRSSGLNLVKPGEKVLILPQNSQVAKDADQAKTSAQQSDLQTETSNFQQWITFLLGGTSRSIEKDNK